MCTTMGIKTDCHGIHGHTLGLHTDHEGIHGCNHEASYRPLRASMGTPMKLRTAP